MTPLQTMQAHQYLYYVKGEPVLSDYEYDMFCKEYGLFGGGGSDLSSSYTPEIIAYADELRRIARGIQIK